MNITGITATIPVATDNQLLNAVSTEVLSQTLDTQETIGDGMTRMMEQSVTPYIGGNFDMSV